jgi:hypothetical protein
VGSCELKVEVSGCNWFSHELYINVKRYVSCTIILHNNTDVSSIFNFFFFFFFCKKMLDILALLYNCCVKDVQITYPITPQGPRFSQKRKLKFYL